MIYGIGIDLIEIKRIENVLKKNEDNFIKKILTQKEIEGIPTNHTRKLEYIAGRYAGKEAIAKAFGTGIGSDIGWGDIEILNEPSGKPFINITKNIKHHDFNFFISISHSESMAIAKVIIEQK